MNASQELWWRQAQSDYDIFELLRKYNVPTCHQLHYLQMATEKIAKAYFWRSGKPPEKLTHRVFVQFLRDLKSPAGAGERIANLLGFKREQDFKNWKREALVLAYELENMAPSLANDGPNPEYPWPSNQPKYAPVTYHFNLWNKFANPHTSNDRLILKVIKLAINKFPEFG